ncbi:uncharacterized protein DNG_04882 [Cephalotrichum gorgonifer]|uniref:Uncharacterized protein n=1 Tax=Cephalotrichum gorgonifer TaxID=2041049 RepID=A0AAE8MYS5_9PEZI|nr:uncharacterized protein DNG_04882 [Cephalotrichum gorgonifer]
MRNNYEEIDTSFDIDLAEDTVGEGGPRLELKATRITPDTNLGDESREQPTNVIDQDLGGKRMTVKCDMVKIIHGTVVSNGSPATLVVFQFAFVPRVIGARYKEAEIMIRFSAGELQSISPAETSVFMRSKTEREVTHSLSPNLQAAHGPVSAGLEYQWQRRESLSITDHAKVTGFIKSQRTRAGQNGTNNTVIWTLHENSQTSSGIPYFVQTALLLKREPPSPGGEEAKFSADIDIKVDVDGTTSVNEATGRVFGLLSNRRQSSKRDKDDGDIRFNPRLSKGTLESGSTSKLKAENLDTFRRLWLFPAWVDGAGEPQLPGKKPRAPEHTGAIENTPQDPRDTTTVTEKALSPAGIGALGLDPDEIPDVGKVSLGLPDMAVPSEAGMPAAGAGKGASAIGVAAKNEICEQLELVRAEAGAVKRLADLIKEERRLLGELRRIQKPWAEKTDPHG